MADTKKMTEAEMKIMIMEQTVALGKQSLLDRLTRMAQQIESAKASVESDLTPMLPNMEMVYEDLKQWEMERCRVEGYRQALK